jgi:hypothetical protein
VRGILKQNEAHSKKLVAISRRILSNFLLAMLSLKCYSIA